MDSGPPALAIFLFCNGSSSPHRTGKLGHAGSSLMFWSAHEELLPLATNTRSEHTECSMLVP